jgi:hypothetical protein
MPYKNGWSSEYKSLKLIILNSVNALWILYALSFLFLPTQNSIQLQTLHEDTSLHASTRFFDDFFVYF